ncbi:hypothetical protein GCM10012287_38540 [Streptomyces daqingensis]|uniref:Secreted protein n=1 Tax=Streptomyces daqingensis TaxID=1472640 RepID=A0ABQ2MKB4_9ACTN|nr:hypothetical protein GCM10012287_38540 [Streptomyces daqingensis]
MGTVLPWFAVVRFVSGTDRGSATRTAYRAVVSFFAVVCPAVGMAGRTSRLCLTNPAWLAVSGTRPHCVVDRRRSPLRSPPSALRSHAPDTANHVLTDVRRYLSDRT